MRSDAGSHVGRPRRSSVLLAILGAGRRLLKWLFNPAPFLTAVRLRYRRELQLAAGLFAVGVLAGLLLAPHLSNGGRSKVRIVGLSFYGLGAGIQKATKELERHNDQEGADESPRKTAWQKFIDAIEEGDVEKANRLWADLDMHDLMAPSPPHVSALAGYLWLVIAVAVTFDTFLLVVLGFIGGLYPVGRTVAYGLALGIPISQTFRGQEGGLVEVSVWCLPVWIILALVTLLSAAIGLDMARFIAQRNAGTWFKYHIRLGLKTWATAVVPPVVIAMVLLATVFVAIVIASGNPVVQ